MLNLNQVVIGTLASVGTFSMVAGCSAGTIEVIGQAFRNGDTTNLVDSRPHRCRPDEVSNRLGNLANAQEYADLHGGPGSVCYIEGSTDDGRTWYTVGS